MKNSFPIIVAIIIAVVSLLAVNSYVKKVNQETAQKLSGQKLVAARVDLPAGAVLQPDMLSPKEVPEQFIPQQAIVGQQEAQMILGRKLKYPVSSGSIVLWSDLELPSRGFSTLIPEGERAYTVNFSAGISPGFINPNDHIDIIASFPLPEETTDSPETIPTWRQASDIVNVVLLQNVTILAVGESFNRSQSQSLGSGPGGSLTLSLSLQESQLVMFAAQHGDLGAVLRRADNIATVTDKELKKVSFREVETIIGDLAEKRKARIIEIQSGQKLQKITIEE
jgi:Flp pilus assembly protein CpaB